MSNRTSNNYLKALLLLSTLGFMSFLPSNFSLHKTLLMEEICDKLGLSSEQVTRNKHVRCKRELEKLIQANPEVKNAILEII